MASYHTDPFDLKRPTRSHFFFSFKNWPRIAEFMARQGAGTLKTVPFRSHAQSTLRPCQLPRLPEPRRIQKWRCRTVGKTGNVLSTDPNKSWAPLKAPRTTAAFQLTRTRSGRGSACLRFGKGQFFQSAGVRACGFCILIPTPLWPASAGFLASSFTIPQAHWFSNERSFTFVSSYLAGVFGL